jgi:hypothetical protein
VIELRPGTEDESAGWLDDWTARLYAWYTYPGMSAAWVNRQAAMILGEAATVAAGDTHLGLNVFGHNSAAIGLYLSMGYRDYDDSRSVEL